VQGWLTNWKTTARDT